MRKEDKARIRQEANQKSYLWSYCGERFLLKGTDIWYVHTEQRKLYVHTKKDCYRVSGNLKAAVELLAELPMIKIHASYLVHMDYLERIGARRAVLKNGEILPVSERFWPSAREAVEAYYHKS